MKTLVIVSHPNFEQSLITKALQNTALAMPGVTVRNLESLYGNNSAAIDVAAEQAACMDVDRIVFLYPTHWFNLTPMLKAYLNVAWTYGWAFGPGGEALKGKELLVVTSAGASEFTYSDNGLINCTMADVLSPLKASALYIGMKFAVPLAFYGVMNATENDIASFQKRFAVRIQSDR
ncbi:NAD(P)H-dependent oxidoreductase [Enterobacter sp.]|uniref:NAD(P)H-dependent oxidoreductase n=1 Tax=Enterobacter sp. TaxID=42895 RepID=UPI0028FE21CB|nr:NAD(P)H-dependent oxidoreductase [Enterobacter sp.]MDU1920110.1 NAD(P)H-dependent oxidoreductase [Enterobacter sp.]MDU2002051.1 NAD(P)H-dependent oxidoreductase [Enterobacter hormaechei]MDU2013739.1 NAD(P)H-dependent oxidoreductase [Enterobacter hormaechei]